MAPQPVSVLFVCLGNICRSTMAEGVFQSLTTSTNPPHPLISHIGSCGTGAYHVGDGPDPRTMSTLKSNNITTYRHRARKFSTKDFDTFDYILAMDEDNLSDLLHLREREVKKRGGDEEGVGRVMLFGVFSGTEGGKGGKKKARGEEIQDPYYGGKDGFEIAFEQCGRFSRVFLEELEGGRLS